MKKTMNLSKQPVPNRDSKQLQTSLCLIKHHALKMYGGVEV